MTKSGRVVLTAILSLALASVVAHAQQTARRESGDQASSARRESGDVPPPPQLRRLVPPEVAPTQKPKATEEVDVSSDPQRTRVAFGSKSLHISCARSLRDLTKNRLECFGNVYIRRPSELLTSDYAEIDLATDQLRAEGNVVYFTPDTVIYGAKMDFNFSTEIGMIYDGRVESNKYQLTGESIARTGKNSFRAFDGEYTTCKDCPASWKLAGKEIDMTIQEYAYLNQVFLKINESPAFYFPYAIIPVKTRRQSGLLWPKIQPVSPFGFIYKQPYFWAISRGTDLKLTAGIYSSRGPKAETEFRFHTSKYTEGEFGAYLLRDRKFPFQDRWAVRERHNLDLPLGLQQKLYYVDARDRDYARLIGDIPGQGEAGLASRASLTKATSPFSTWVSATYIHSLLTPELSAFDANTVQVMPSFNVWSKDHKLIDPLPLRWGLQASYDRFTRSGPAFDSVIDYTNPMPEGFFVPGTTPLRIADRFRFTPEVYMPIQLGRYIELLPSAQYRTYYYLFDEKAPVAPAMRGYLVTSAEVATVMEKVYDGKLKHKFRPSLTYSNIPVIQESQRHPFIKQIKTTGYQFDEFDIMPISYDSAQIYYIPLGNSLSYQVNNKFILKSDKAPYQYKKTLEVTSGQTVNFIEFRNSDPKPLSRFFTTLAVDTLRVQANGTYFYYPTSRRSVYSVGATYIFAKYTRRLLSFERSIGVRYAADAVTGANNQIGGSINWSLNDSFSGTASTDYMFPILKQPGRLLKLSAGVTYQSPSQCYSLTLSAAWTFEQPQVSMSFNLPINLTGDSFSSITEGGGIAPSGG